MSSFHAAAVIDSACVRVCVCVCALCVLVVCTSAYHVFLTMFFYSRHHDTETAAENDMLKYI